MSWLCHRCGSCCEVLLPNCKYYDKEKKLCEDFDNRPWMCIQHHLLGEQYSIDTCKLLQHLQVWRNEIKDKRRCDRLVDILMKNLFGADELQKKEALLHISNSGEVNKIQNDMNKFKDAFAKKGEQ